MSSLTIMLVKTKQYNQPFLYDGLLLRHRTFLLTITPTFASISGETLNARVFFRDFKPVIELVVRSKGIRSGKETRGRKHQFA